MKDICETYGVLEGWQALSQTVDLALVLEAMELPDFEVHSDQRKALGTGFSLFKFPSLYIKTCIGW